MTQRKAETEMEAAKAPINSEIEKVEMN